MQILETSLRLVNSTMSCFLVAIRIISCDFMFLGQRSLKWDTLPRYFFVRSMKIKQQFIKYMGAGGFQNMFCLVDEKRILTSSKFPFRYPDIQIQNCNFVTKPLKKFSYDSGNPLKSLL
jgi:hypothetical protein